jgi:hypothetical protein
MTSNESYPWEEFLAEVAKKTKSTSRKIGTLAAALNNSPARPVIYLLHGIHGNILFPDAGYCEFDDAGRAWEHLQAWADMVSKVKDDPSTWDGCFPVGFEIGIVSIEELEKTHPAWETLKDCGADIINPLYGEPYLRHCYEESTIHQFELGIDAMERHGLQPTVFASSEHALHPQLPQLLRAFGIGFAFATARLAGGAPTSYHPKVLWEGLDGTAIPAIAQQSGLPNGHVWHGKFFEEVPSLIFAAVARPDLQTVVYANIEDFANPMPGSEAFASHVQELERQKIRIRGFSAMASEDLPLSRKVCWTIEDFPIRRMQSKLIALARRCEDLLVLVEAFDALQVAVGGIPPHGEILADAWTKLLAAQNHDAYVVPFTTPGIYSTMQGLQSTGPAWSSNETIEDHSARYIDEAASVASGILDDLGRTDYTGAAAGAFNMLWARDAVAGDRVFSLPAFGYSCTNSPFSSPRAVDAGERGVVYHECPVDLGIELGESIETPTGFEFAGDGISVHASDLGSSLRVDIETGAPMHLSVPASAPPVISYPFGAEPSTEAFGHAHRFAWVDGRFVIMHDGTPYFSHVDGTFSIEVPKGRHSFAIAYAPSLLDAYRHTWEFCYPPILFQLAAGMPNEASACEIEFAGTVPTSFRLVDGRIRARFLSVDGSLPSIPGGMHVDMRGNPEEPEPVPWRIHNYILPPIGSV